MNKLILLENNIISFLLLFVFFMFNSRVYADASNVNSVIKVYVKTEKGQVNKRIFGSNLLGYYPPTFENWGNQYYGFADFGAGIWTPKYRAPVNAVLDIAKEIKLSVIRFPGGMGANYYKWKLSVGNRREHFLFGLDEFLETSEQLGAEVILTVNCISDQVQDAVDLVEYLNCVDDGQHKWAAERTKNNHKNPYNISYFEIGNEVWDVYGAKFKDKAPEVYAYDYIRFYDSMKKKDPNIKIGIILYAPEWDRKVLSIVQDKIDFAVLHTYPTPVWGEALSRLDPRKIFFISWAIPIITTEQYFRETLALLRNKALKDIPLAITEYNGGFVQEKPVPYRHSLGNAILIGELLKTFIKFDNNILFANYWNFVNEQWGVISNNFDGTEKTLNNPYFKRPNYYVFELYSKYFGDVLIESSVQSDSYDIGKYNSFLKDLVNRMKAGAVVKFNLSVGSWIINDFPGVIAKVQESILMIDFDNPQAFNYFHAYKKIQVEPDTYYKLSGYIKTDNLIDTHGVCFEVQDSRGWNATHSSQCTEYVVGNAEFTYVNTIYKTLPDATSVIVIARRVGNEGPLHGKAYFKDVRLEKFVPTLDTKIPYLSVNASKSKDGNKVYLMVINKNMDNSITSTINLQDFVSNAKGNAWVLNGPSVDATNEKDHDNVKINHRTFEIASATTRPRNDTTVPLSYNGESTKFEYTFEPHSLTAIEIERAK